jgi:hypothetical protein
VIDPTRFDPKLWRALCPQLVDRVEQSCFDESAVPYEAARLDHHPVVFVWHFEGVECHLTVVKGAEEFARYLCGENPSMEFESIFAQNGKAALALRAALQRRATPLRLVQ